MLRVLLISIIIIRLVSVPSPLRDKEKNEKILPEISYNVNKLSKVNKLLYFW